MTTWEPVYTGDGPPRARPLPPPPPWRSFTQAPDRAFVPPPGFVQAVNAALFLRKPLLITGLPGSGKTTAIEAVAAEACLGPVLRWHITSRSALRDGLYSYDALGRINAQQTGDGNADGIEPFLTLGPLGTALLPAGRPRALLIDEIDKSDLDLPSDLLDVLERGFYSIPELVRYKASKVVIRSWDGLEHEIESGRVQCTEFPFVIMTSNEERDFPPPFLRRCIRYDMPNPTVESLTDIVRAHLDPGQEIDAELARLIDEFVRRLDSGETLAIDQLLNVIHIVGASDVGADQEALMKKLILKDLAGG